MLWVQFADPGCDCAGDAICAGLTVTVSVSRRFLNAYTEGATQAQTKTEKTSTITNCLII